MNLAVYTCNFVAPPLIPFPTAPPVFSECMGPDLPRVHVLVPSVNDDFIATVVPMKTIHTGRKEQIWAAPDSKMVFAVRNISEIPTLFKHNNNVDATWISLL